MRLGAIIFKRCKKEEKSATNRNKVPAINKEERNQKQKHQKNHRHVSFA